jgi:hypothetical protein
MDDEIIYQVENPYFCYSATLRVSGEISDLDEITRRLDLTPTHAHRKGEKRGPRSPGYKQDMWAYKPPVEETRPLEEHIQALWDAIRPNTSYLKFLKQTLKVDVFCGYRTNCSTAGFEVDHKCLGLFVELEVPFGVSVIVWPDESPDESGSM